VTGTATRTPGVIRADEAYTVAEFRRRATLQRYALSQAQRAGLRIVAVGRKRYVLGADWLAFLAQQAELQT
jgi:hypothetical protein